VKSTIPRNLSQILKEVELHKTRKKAALLTGPHMYPYGPSGNSFTPISLPANPFVMMWSTGTFRTVDVKRTVNESLGGMTEEIGFLGVDVLSNCRKSSFVNRCFGTKQYSVTTVSKDDSNTDLSNAEDSETSAEDEPLPTCIAL
jgi:hypothetical protein